MNILFISHCYPWPLDNGTVQRVYHLIDQFARRHDVTLVALRDDDRAPTESEASALTERCARVVSISARECGFASRERFARWAPVRDRVATLLSSPLPGTIQRGYSPALVRHLRRVRESQQFDAIWVERGFLAENVRRAGFKNFLVDIDELESVSLFRLLRHSGRYASKITHYAELAKLYAYERALPVRFWRVAVCKEEDRRFFGVGRPKVFVVPNGIPTLPPSPVEKEDPGNILFVGSLEYEPNMDAIRRFRTEVLPRIRVGHPKARFVIVGRNATPEMLALQDGDCCTVASSVPDVTPYFEAASLVVVPMRLGGGTKLKLLEALARGKAVVSTTIGAQGLDLRPGVDLEIADDTSTQVRACQRLLTDSRARHRLGRNGRERVQARYRWDVIGEEAERVLFSGPTPGQSIVKEPSLGS